jgi:hypothetical protein
MTTSARNALRVAGLAGVAMLILSSPLPGQSSFCAFEVNVRFPNGRPVARITVAAVEDGKQELSEAVPDKNGVARICDAPLEAPFFSGRQADGRPLGGVFAGMSLSAFQQVTVIHEFMHWMRIVGLDANDQQYTLPNATTVTGTAGIYDEIKRKCL